MTENEVAKIFVDCCYKVHTTLGPGLFESIYESALLYELRQCNLRVVQQMELPVIYEDVNLGIGFRADIVIENKVIIEIKSVAAIAPVHYKQLLTYLKLTELKLGFLVNFNEARIKDGLHRMVNNL